jgi:hypothetical protein
MILPVSLFTLVIYLALAVVVAAPIILLLLWLRDLRRGALW